MKKKLSVAAIMIFLTTAMLLAAQPALRGPASGRGLQGKGLFAGSDFLPARLLLRAKDKIGLNADQEKKISAMIDAHEQWAVKFGAEMKIKALKLRTALAAEKTNLDAAEQMIREQAGMRAEMQIAGLRLQKDVQTLLTPEQAARVAVLKKDFRGRLRDGVRQRLDRRRGRRN